MGGGVGRGRVPSILFFLANSRAVTALFGTRNTEPSQFGKLIDIDLFIVIMEKLNIPIFSLKLLFTMIYHLFTS